MGRGRSRARMWSQLETRELRRRAAPAPHTPRAHSGHSCRLPGREHADSRGGGAPMCRRGAGGALLPGSASPLVCFLTLTRISPALGPVS